ncbi:MAG: DUF4394 domain-containing protein [Phycisphaerales bacterium]|jgi:hypothetical protein
MSSVIRAATVAAFAGLALTAAASAQQTVYAIGNGGSSLVRFQSNNPGSATVVADFSGAASFLDAIDFRPSTGQLYGYLDSTDSFYTVNLNTGALTLASVGASGAPTNTFQLGMDFNPTIDRLRVVTDSGQNVVYNPVVGTAAAFTSLAYAIGDVNENASPSIIDNAYTQNFAGAATTQQYGIDYANDSLVRIANNAGTLTTVGFLGIDTDIYTGFDVYTGPGGVDTGYAILTPAGGAPRFYNINLTTGQATLVGDVGFTNQVYSLAVIPSPGTAMLLALPLGAGLVRRRRAM